MLEYPSAAMPGRGASALDHLPGRGDGPPYAQRADRRPGALDRACLGVLGRLAAFVDRSPRRLRACAAAVEARAASAEALGDDALRAALQALRPRLIHEGLARHLVTAALALFAEACRRSTGLRPHPVQLMAAFALVEGRLAEMQTGEGKTIVAALVAGTAGLAGLPTHVVTVNDYLAARDAALARPILAFAGLDVGVVRHDDPADRRRAQYRCDVTYVSNKELAFDYLRDRVAAETGSVEGRARPASGWSASGSPASGSPARHDGGPEANPPPILRGLHFAIVDEADSILIDEARTPLILSQQTATAVSAEPEQCRLAMAAAAGLTEHRHYTVASHARQVTLTADGSAAVARALAEAGGIWRARQAREELVRHALAARLFYKRDRDYLVVDGAIRIVDEHTGRIAEGRSWQNGLHQLIEAVEGVPASARHVTCSTITFQSFFCRYIRLAGLSGTLTDVAAETRAVYGRATIRIPTHRPPRRRDLGTRLLPAAEAKWAAVAAAAATHRADGRAVLIGTRSVAASERLSARLSAAGLAHVVLNARHDAQEAAIIAEAGRAGRITVATNMAGRGTDIRPDPQALRNGGLHVILTELHESRRIDRQLIGRGGRQGDPASFELILSLEDELFGSYAPLAAAAARTLCAVSQRLAPLVLAWLRRRAQVAAEHQHRRDRGRVALAHDRLKDILAFAGTTG